jgi:hypothetical protein
MSAFLVETTTINKIISWLRHEFLHSSLLRRVATRFAMDIESEDWEQRLAEKMYALNVTAVNQRYHKSDPAPEIVYSLYPYTSRISAWKALSCWLYQCSEGAIPQSTLFQFFEELKKQTAVLIIQNLPEYEQARWG